MDGWMGGGLKGGSVEGEEYCGLTGKRRHS